MRYFLLLSLPLFLIDQATKLWIVATFPEGPPYRVIEVIPDFFNIVRVHNTGMAFGVLNGNPLANWIFGAIGVLAVTGIAILWRKGAFPDRLSKVSGALLIAGILGNFTDRILHGYVVDFLDFQPPFYEAIDPSGHFPSFNIADSCICIAAALLVLSAFRSPSGKQPADSPAQP